jgi:hypothetical protein
MFELLTTIRKTLTTFKKHTTNSSSSKNHTDSKSKPHLAHIESCVQKACEKLCSRPSQHGIKTNA